MKDLMSKAEVAAELGCSERNVVDLLARRKLTPRKVRRVGKPPVNMFDPDEVAELRQERIKQATTLLSAVASVNSKALVPSSSRSVAVRGMSPFVDNALMATPSVPLWHK